MQHSCIYEGRVWHRRNAPVAHQFQNRLFMVYLDLAELAQLVGDGRLIGDRKMAGRSFLNSDHLFDETRSMRDEVRHVIEQQTGIRPNGPIRLLTQLRYFGHYFSPLNMFYVYDENDERVEFVLAEVSNTPWNERHYYTLWHGNQTGDRTSLRFSHPKEFHVSPFMGMDLEYRWNLTQPGDDLSIQLSNLRDDEVLFSAGMKLKRRELTNQQLNRMTLRYPVMTAQIVAAIYYQAFRLWWKKCPFYKHPKKPDSTSKAPPPPDVSLPSRTEERREQAESLH